jgi:integrase
LAFCPPISAELAAMYQATAPHLRRAIMLGYCTGIRPGQSEKLVFRWDRADAINGTIFVESTKKGGMAAWTIPIADGLVASCAYGWQRT